ncbi:MAG: 1-acyl-sn-glycerol-3-phosphate acyltransferase [Planctomycetes bacterium]|nr:1-acyl-sn-glycerol-3-phosphate acyltransferase [Planctomycetota bacterium]
MTGAALWKLRSRGQELVPRTGGVLLASNHQSVLDPPLVAACVDREVHFMARKSLFEIPVFGSVIVAYNAFPIVRDSGDVKGVKTAIERLKAGSALLMFPEGTRTRDGRIGPMKSGIRLVAERAAVPIVPVLVEGAYKVWPKGQRLPCLWGRITVTFGRPLDPSSLGDEGLREAIIGLSKRNKEKRIHVQ